MSQGILRLFFLAVLQPLVACHTHTTDSPVGEVDGDVRGDAESDADSDVIGDIDGDIDLGDDGDLGNDADIDSDDACESEPFEAFAEPVRVMLLLDQSSSMVESSWGGHDHWSEVRTALTELLSEARIDDFQFGMDPFPDADLAYLEDCHDDCCQDSVCFQSELLRCMNMATRCNRSCNTDLPPWVPLAEASISGTQIIEYLNLDVVPLSFGLTPIVDQMRYYLADHSAEMPAFYSNDGNSYLVIATDGQDTCEGDRDDPDNVRRVTSELEEVTSDLVGTWGIRSIAVGFGGLFREIPDQLNAIAANGDTEFDSFFSVYRDGAFYAALDTIISSIGSCLYNIDDPDAVAHPDAVNFFFDGEIVGNDASCRDGWRWVDSSHNQVEFCGASCACLREGEVMDVEGRFGCPTVIW